MLFQWLSQYLFSFITAILILIVGACSADQDFSKLGTVNVPTGNSNASLVCTTNKVSLKSGQSTLLTWNNVNSVPVTFSVSSPNSTSTTIGTLSKGTLSSVNYAAPTTAPVAFVANVTATVVSDPSITATCAVTLSADGSLGNPDQGQQGLVANVYPVPTNTQVVPANSVLSSIKPVQTLVLPNLDYPEGPYTDPIPGVSLSSWYALVIQGQLLIAQSGTYMFNQLSDDGSRVYVDGNLIIDLSTHATLSQTSSPITLAAGAHVFEVVYEQKMGPRLGLQTSIAMANANGSFAPFSIIPPSQFQRPAVNGGASKSLSAMALGELGAE
jgi:hypothetical protein